MALIDNDHVTSSDNSQTTWEDALQNAKVLLYEIDAAILAILQGKIQTYELNSGQGSRSVKKLSLSDLRELKTEIMSQISDLEGMLGYNSNTVQVIPGF